MDSKESSNQEKNIEKDIRPFSNILNDFITNNNANISKENQDVDLDKSFNITDKISDSTEKKNDEKREEIIEPKKIINLEQNITFDNKIENINDNFQNFIENTDKDEDYSKNLKDITNSFFETNIEQEIINNSIIDKEENNYDKEEIKEETIYNEEKNNYDSNFLDEYIDNEQNQKEDKNKQENNAKKENQLKPFFKDNLDYDDDHEENKEIINESYKEDEVMKNTESLIVKEESPGEILKKTRKKFGYSIEEVSRNIYMSIKYIKALENDDYYKFYAPAYFIGFLRTYAQYLYLDPDELVNKYKNNDIERLKMEEYKIKMELDSQGKKKWLLFIIIFAVLSVIGISSLYAEFFLHKSNIFAYLDENKEEFDYEKNI